MSIKTQIKPFSIKPAERQNMSKVADLIRSSADWYAEFVDEGDLSEHYVDKQWEERNYAMRDFYLGRNHEDETVGTLSLQHFHDYTYIGYLYLDVAHVGQGYGKKFMDFACQEALKKGKKGLFLIAHPEAVWAVKAYEKFGFKCIAETREDITTWNYGVLNSFYEEGFHLYVLDFGTYHSEVPSSN